MHTTESPRKQIHSLSEEFYNPLRELPLRDRSCFDRTAVVLTVVWTLGDVLRKLRQGKGWTQEQLGIAAGGLHKTVINRLEKSGAKRSEQATIERVAQALKVAVSELHLAVEDATLFAGMSEAERRAVREFQHRLIAKRPPSTAPIAESPLGLPAPARESRAPVQKRRQR